MSRCSSIRVATESRIERAFDDEICIRAPRERNSAASGASSRGASTMSCPGRCSTKSLIQRTDCTSCNTCRKQMTMPRAKTTPTKPFNSGLARKTPRSIGNVTTSPAATATVMMTIRMIWRTGWLKRGADPVVCIRLLTLSVGRENRGAVGRCQLTFGPSRTIAGVRSIDARAWQARPGRDRQSRDRQDARRC